MNRCFLYLSTYLFVVAITMACTAGRVKDDRPLPVDDLDARGIAYLVKASMADLQEATSEQLRSRYGQSVLRTGMTGYGTPSWNLSTSFREYRLNGKRYRSECYVHCFSFKEFPQYVYLYVACEVERHGLHSVHPGLPDWGWHTERKEQRLHLANDLINDIVRVAAIPESHLIRLRRDPRYEESIKLIEAREKQ